MQRIGILTSGGDAPGMNAAVRAATRAALARGWEVYGVRNGFAGLLQNTMDPLHARDVGGIIQRGGTVLGSARSPEFQQESGRAKALANVRRRGIDALIVIGGNGTQSGSFSLHEAGFPVVGVASTIDNDLYGTDITIGVDTAVNITLEAIDRLRTTASSHQRAFLVETMGRNCGYIALMTGIAGGAEVIVTPECEMEPDEVIERLAAAYTRGKTHALVVVAEGAKHGARMLMDYFRDHRATIGFGLRLTTLGHVVRGGVPTAADRVLATRLGAAAVDQLATGTTGVLMGMQCNAVSATPLAEIAGRTKPMDCAMLELARVLAQ
ncbi:MAG TPA: ATP-dependent 6-phosphofructokinase [Burkholderiales bacterium]|nr:ATP-dependent 6-phosphofructokinase [Burkholderiales bacterium]